MLYDKSQTTFYGISFLILTIFVLNFEVYSQTKLSVKNMEIKITSPAFKEGGNIDSRFSCQGADFSPHLLWDNNLKNVKSYAIIMDDPDAPGGDFVHWIIFNIPGNMKELNENVTPSGNIPPEVKFGTNSFGHIGYSGPCPPSGKPHRYFFKIYALDTILLHTEAGATKQQLLKAMDGHIIASGQLIGLYKRI